MKITALIPVALLAAAMTGPLARAQESSAPAAPAAPTVINGVVYAQTLPTPTALMKDAEAEGLTIVRMEQSPEKIVVVYQYPNGATRAFAYTTSVATTTQVVERPAAPAMPISSATYSVVQAPAPTTTVVYTEPARVYYTPNYAGYYDPWYPWAPLALGVGLGLSWDYGHHGYYGGHYRGHGGYYGGRGRH
jgi:hypothetical protein